jgi:hypothetical protein
MSPAPTLTFTVDGPIVPGQPLTFKWFLFDPLLDGSPMNPGQLTAQILIEGNQIWKAPAPVLWSAIYVPIAVPDGLGKYTVGKSNFPLGWGAGETQTIQLAPGSAGNLLYAIGTNTLELIVTGSGQTPGPWTAQANLVVSGESIDKSWWTWGPGPAYGNGPDTALWGGGANKNFYSVSGSFRNKSRYANLTYSYKFLESPTGIKQGTGSVTVEHVKSSQEIVSSQISQSWEFIIIGVWQLDGSFNRTFTYTVQFLPTDNYGNQYDQVVSDTLNIDVEVAVWKQIAAGTAMSSADAAALYAAAAAAAFAGIFSIPAGAVLAGIAAGLYAAATTAGGTARDPAEPDPKFGESVEIHLSEFPASLMQSPEYPSTVQFAVRTVRMLERIAALDAIHGKILGASVAGDNPMLFVQVSVYVGVIAQVRRDLAELTEFAIGAQHELEGVFASDDRFEMLRSWVHEDGSSAVRAEMARHFDLAEITNGYLADIVVDNDRLQQITSPTTSVTNLVILLRQLVEALSINALQIIGTISPTQ